SSSNGTIYNSSYRHVTYFNKYFIAFSDSNNGIVISQDGKNWASSTVFTGTWNNSYVYKGYLYALSGSNAGVIRTKDGRIFDVTSISSGSFINAAATSNIMVISGTNGGYWSENGFNFTVY